MTSDISSTMTLQYHNSVDLCLSKCHGSTINWKFPTKKDGVIYPIDNWSVKWATWPLSLLLVTYSYLKMQGEYFRTIPRVSEAPPTPSLKEFTFQLFKILHFVSTKGTWKSNGKESKELLFHIIYLSFVATVVHSIFSPFIQYVT